MDDPALSGSDPENGAYSRRRIDELTDHRIRSIEGTVGEIRSEVRGLDAKVDLLSSRLAYIFGGVVVLSVLMNIVGPIVVSEVVGR